jgi:hypothetical protein
LEIAYAGTSCSTRFRGFFENAYNIVDVGHGKSQIDIKIVGGKRVPLSDLVSKYKPPEISVANHLYDEDAPTI